MSSLLESLTKQLGGGALQQISRQLGSNEQTTGSAVAVALPTLLGALARNSSKPEGAQLLHKALEKDHDGGVLDDLTGAIGKAETGPGNAILGHLLGGRRPRVESSISKSTGMDAGAVGKLMSTLAPIVMGALGRQQRSARMDAGGLSQFLGGERKQSEGGASSMGFVGALLDSDGDGDVDMSDIAKKGMGLLGKMFGGRG